jgi:hypothetical protein
VISFIVLISVNLLENSYNTPKRAAPAEAAKN